jgi:hypothetical protein
MRGFWEIALEREVNGDEGEDWETGVGRRELGENNGRRSFSQERIT